MSSAIRYRCAALALRMYPVDWRRRYRAEVLTLLDELPPTWGQVAGLWVGALREQIAPPAALFNVTIWRRRYVWALFGVYFAGVAITAAGSLIGGTAVVATAMPEHVAGSVGVVLYVLAYLRAIPVVIGRYLTAARLVSASPSRRWSVMTGIRSVEMPYWIAIVASASVLLGVIASDMQMRFPVYWLHMSPLVLLHEGVVDRLRLGRVVGGLGKRARRRELKALGVRRLGL